METVEIINRKECSYSEKPNSSDTISRQAAIRWVKTECNPYGKPTLEFESGKKVIEHLEQMPSAQPDLDEWCTDCKEYDKEKHHCPRFNRVIREALKDAQPERKTGHWEIYIISMLDGEGCRCSECGSEGVPYWDFCPNCGADMRGDE